NGLPSQYGGPSGLPPPPVLSVSPQSFQRGQISNPLSPNFEDMAGNMFRQGPNGREQVIPPNMLPRDHPLFRENGPAQQPPRGMNMNQPPSIDQHIDMLRNQVGSPGANAVPQWLAQQMQHPGVGPQNPQGPQQPPNPNQRILPPPGFRAQPPPNPSG